MVAAVAVNLGSYCPPTIEATASYRCNNQLSLRNNNRLKFETSGELPIVDEESMENTFIS